MSCCCLRDLFPRNKSRSIVTILIRTVVLMLIATGFWILWNYNYSIAWLPRIKLDKPIVSDCGLRSQSRGYNQRVVSYSLHGSLEDQAIINRYVMPLVNTSRTFPSKYPGWTMRIYHNVPLNEIKARRILDEYFGDESQVANFVDLCFIGHIQEANANALSLHPRTWRFLPLLDEQVDLFVSRDSDSLILERELDAVREWLGSNYTFHVMRDHLYHCTATMLAGMWGAKINKQRDIIRQTGSKMFTYVHPQRKTFDQEILNELMWPLAQTSLMSHDSYCCERFMPTRNESVMKPFPNQRKGGEFVGRVELFPGKDFQTLGIECPVQCRPYKNKNWRFC